METKHVLLISFYNQASLGLRYLENACKRAGIDVKLVFFKTITYANPAPCTETELELLRNYMAETKPDVVGLSLMSSICIQTVKTVNAMIKKQFDIPVVWGGTYPTMFPEDSLEHADFVIRGEGEEALVELCDALMNGKPYERILNLAYRKDGQAVVNEIRPLCGNLDVLGYPVLDNGNKTLIDGEKSIPGDPRMRGKYYELAASRGCPFGCSFCCAIALKRLYRGKGSFLRFRSVDSVINELREAKQKMSDLKKIRFWDEVFSDDPSWVDSFVRHYREEINIPFEIWCHPLKIDKELIEKLRSAGLDAVVMGIQSGSDRIRKDIFHRGESREAIIRASEIFTQCKIPSVSYDFMLQHPFETHDDIRESYLLCLKLKGKFTLQMHGLMFFPGSDIAAMALERGLFTSDEMEKLMYGTYKEQFDAYHKYENHDEISTFWHQLIFMTQIPHLRPVTRLLSKNADSALNRRLARGAYAWAQRVQWMKNKAGRARLKLKGYVMTLRGS